MVVPTRNDQKTRPIDLPIIDLSGDRSEISKLLVKASEEFGFFKVVNHGVSQDVIKKMEAESFGFFAKPTHEKNRAGPTNPYGYGSKNIGPNGDVGEVEYLLLSANPLSVSQRSKTISDDPLKFSSAVIGYIEAVKGLACEILELMAEGLWVSDTSVFSRMISDSDSDSVLRLNHYPPLSSNATCHQTNRTVANRIGFGEHSDPQILTLLRSNDVSGLQISLEDGVWVPVTPDPTAFCVNVGDVLQVMTNGRFVSVRHRALVNTDKPRMSIAYFGAPSRQTWIAPPPELIKPDGFCLYRPFTWGDYKKATYSLTLGETRLHLFRADRET